VIENVARGLHVLARLRHDERALEHGLDVYGEGFGPVGLLDGGAGVATPLRSSRG
jgi:hypothetical protein